jgi:UDP-2,3-diacylglucosamine pyrophosphatase LpxH
MLALISDLHFCDGTATFGNVAPEVFALALREIYETAAEVARMRDQPTHLDLVFLGDIFDLLRTERWFEDAQGSPVPLAERPWGSAEAARSGRLTVAAAARTRAILAEILQVNAAALATLRGESLPPPEGVLVRRIYVPGNHDRLYLHDAALRAGILGGLGAVDGEGLSSEGIFLHRLEMPKYGILARHGHEWDVWNFPSFERDAVPSEYSDADYLPAPIGDAVTAEMAARLPYEMRLRLLSCPRFPRELADHVHRRMMRIEDVRPLFASFHWAFFAVSVLAANLDRDRARLLHAALRDTLRTLARSFRDLDFYQAWQEIHHRPFHLDAALVLRLILCGLSAPSFFPLEWIALQVERVLASRAPRTVTRRGALREDLSRVGSREMRFVVYGHTHEPERVPLHGSPEVQDVYLNTGTYRPGVFRADDGLGFVGWQRLGYACILSAEEAVGQESPFGFRNVGPAFVAWSGGQSTGAVSRVGAAPIR